MDKDCDVAGVVVEKLFRAELHNALAQLSEKERQIIFMLFGDSRISEAQCALTLGCTQQNIHYLKQRALQKMKNFLEN